MSKERYDLFRERLKTILADKNQTASDVAAQIWDRHLKDKKSRKIERGRDRLSVWINGKYFPEPVNRNKLAKALGVPVSELDPDEKP